MEKIGSLDMSNVGPLKMYSRKSKSKKKARLDLDEQKEEGMGVDVKVDVHPIHDGVDIVGEKNGHGFSGVLSEKMESFTAETSSVGDDHFLNYSVVQVEENLKKPPKKRRRVADWEDVSTKMKGGVISKISTDQGGDLGTEQKGQTLFEMPREVNSSDVMISNSGIECRYLERLVEEVVWPEEGNAMKVPEKRKRGADGDMGKVLSSPKKYSPCSKLRPRTILPSFQKIELEEKDFERIVGKRMKVYWSGSRKWFVGRIKSYDRGRKRHKVLYDDGEKEDLDIRKEDFELEVTRDEGFKLCSKSRANPEENNMNPGGGDIIEVKDNNGSHDVAHLEQEKEHVSITQKKVAEIAIEGTCKIQQVKDTDESTEDTNPVVEVRSMNNEDQVTRSNNTYWYMYGEFSTEKKKHSSLDVVCVGQSKKNAGLDEKPGSEQGFQLQGRAEDLVDVVIDMQPTKNEFQVDSPGAKESCYKSFPHPNDDLFSNLNLQSRKWVLLLQDYCRG